MPCFTSRPTRLAATAAATKTTIVPLRGRRSLHVQRLAAAGAVAQCEPDAADESGQLQGSAAQARLLGMLVRITGAAFGDCRGTGSLVETCSSPMHWITRAC